MYTLMTLRRCWNVYRWSTGDHNVVGIHFKFVWRSSVFFYQKYVPEAQKMRDHGKLHLPTRGQSQFWQCRSAGQPWDWAGNPSKGHPPGWSEKLRTVLWGSPWYRFVSESGGSCTGRAGAKSCRRQVLVTRAWQLFSHSDQVLKALQGRTDSHKEVASYGSCSLKALPAKLGCWTSSEVGGCSHNMHESSV